MSSNKIRECINSGMYDNNSPQSKIPFKKLLEQEFNTKRNQKRDLLFEKAWDLGHSAGYYEVAIHYEDLLPLIQ